MTMAKKTTKKAAPKAGKEDNSVLFGVLTYLFFIVGLIWYLVDDEIKKNAFAKYHFKQSLVLVITAIILSFAASIIPLLNIVLVPLVELALLVLVILGIVNVVNREQKELPVIGSFGEKFSF